MTLPLKLALVLVLLHNISAAQYHNIWKKTFPFLKEIEKNKYFHFFKKSKKPVLPIAAYHLPHRRAGGWDRRRPPGQPPCAQRQGSNDEHVRRMASDGVERTAGGREAHPAIFPTCVRVRPGSVSAAPRPAQFVPPPRRGVGKAGTGRVEHLDEDRRSAAIGCKAKGQMCRPHAQPF